MRGIKEVKSMKQDVVYEKKKKVMEIITMQEVE